MKLKKSAPKESSIQSAIMQYLTIKNILHWRVPLGGVSHMVGGKMVFKKNPIKGFPDLAGIIEGHFFAIEVKSALAKPTPEQIQWHDRIKKAGGYVCVARSIEDVQSFLQSMQLSLSKNHLIQTIL